MYKNSLNNFICHLSWLEKLSPYSYTSPYIHLWIFKTLWVIIFLSLSFDPPHPTPTWPTPPPSWPTPPLHDPTPSWPTPSHPTPGTFLGTKEPFFHGLLHYVSLLWVIIFWVRVTHKMLNVNCIKIHSIILSVICHGLRNFCPYSYTSPQTHSWIFETLKVIIFWIRVTCKMLNVTCIKFTQ